MDYPLHLGVTEAGEGEDGRIKSAVGIVLFWKMDWVIRSVFHSRKEPEAEIPVAKALADRYASPRTAHLPEFDSVNYHPFE
jgi:(E)-4-hydroxy-3-methylbut-2-enyl-diphosphate synthase